jgi:hypothetical protein
MSIGGLVLAGPVPAVQVGGTAKYARDFGKLISDRSRHLCLLQRLA